MSEQADRHRGQGQAEGTLRRAAQVDHARRWRRRRPGDPDAGPLDLNGFGGALRDLHGGLGGQGGRHHVLAEHPRERAHRRCRRPSARTQSVPVAGSRTPAGTRAGRGGAASGGAGTAARSWRRGSPSWPPVPGRFSGGRHRRQAALPPRAAAVSASFRHAFARLRDRQREPGDYPDRLGVVAPGAFGLAADVHGEVAVDHQRDAIPGVDDRLGGADRAHGLEPGELLGGAGVELAAEVVTRALDRRRAPPG